MGLLLKGFEGEDLVCSACSPLRSRFGRSVREHHNTATKWLAKTATGIRIERRRHHMVFFNTSPAQNPGQSLTCDLSDERCHGTFVENAWRVEGLAQT